MVIDESNCYHNTAGAYVILCTFGPVMCSICCKGTLFPLMFTASYSKINIQQLPSALARLIVSVV